MAVAKEVSRVSEADYLEMERAAEFKSEFYDGEMFAMAGGSRWHSLISLNMGAELRSRLKGSGCVVFNSDLRLKVEASGLYTYPDAIVTCEEARFLDSGVDTVLNPTLLVEVLSESTEAYDRGKKFEQYRQIPSFREYLLVSQREPRIEQFVRQENDDWLLHEAVGLERELTLHSLGIRIALAEVFANVVFSPAPLRVPAPPRS